MNSHVSPDHGPVVAIRQRSEPSCDSSGSLDNSASTAMKRILNCPDDFGLLVTLDSAGICKMEFVEDINLKEIHPHCRVPATICDVKRLRGGGSGVTVFQGVHPEFGNIVMKHGGHKDTGELFALATIAEQLQARGIENDSLDSASEMQARIPEFMFIYISPRHLRSRGTELWCCLKEMIFSNFDAASSDSESSDDCPRRPMSNGNGRCIELYTNDNTHLRVNVHKHRVEICLGADTVVNDQRVMCGAAEGGYACLSAFVLQLRELQEEHFWKITLAQKTIGGPSARTASSLLAAGLLHGDLLQNLLSEFVSVIRNLQKLTLPVERDALYEVQQEVAKMEREKKCLPEEVSDLANAFVGLAIKKNFHSEKGRFKKIRDMGAKFRSGSLILIDDEKLPVHHLGALLQRGVRMEDVFALAPTDVSTLDTIYELLDDAWLGLLRHATSFKGRAMMDRIWTCGLTDAGLHNLFLDEGRLWLFDLGEPTLQPLPAFLTKFLMSFFHTLGMDEDDDGDWVMRFVPGETLSLTEHTEELLPKVYDAFEVTLNCFVETLFNGEAGVRGLLIKYITFQLLSDAAFCLEKWEIKGGGAERVSDSSQPQHLEKWLWRALWDFYIAADVSSKLLGSWDMTDEGTPSGSTSQTTAT